MRSIANWAYDAATVLRDPSAAPFTGSVELPAQKFVNTEPYWNSGSAFGEIDVIARIEALTTAVNVAIYVGDETVSAATGTQVSLSEFGTVGSYKVPLDLNEIHAEIPDATHYVVVLTAVGGAADVAVYLTAAC